MAEPALKSREPKNDKSGSEKESNSLDFGENRVQLEGNHAAYQLRSGIYQLSNEAVVDMHKDTDVVIREIQAAFPKRTLIVSLVSKWQGRDRDIGEAAGTPYLDKFFSILEGTNIEKRTWRTGWAAVPTNALDSLVHTLESNVVFRQQFRSSIAYKEYFVKPEVSAIWQWELMLAKELNEYVELGEYGKVIAKLKDVNTTFRDNVSVALVAQMSDKNLLSVAQSKEGNDLLTRLYDELSSGSFGDDEMHQAKRIFDAKNAAFAANTSNLEEGMINPNIKIFPHRKTGITVGAFGAPAAQIHAVRSRVGFIKVKMTMSVFTSPAYKREAESLGIEAFSRGIEIPENEIVRVVQYDEGGAEIDRPAYYLLEISNEDTSHTFQKIGEVAGYALMFGPGVAVEGGIQAVTFAARAARFLKYADNVAMAVGIFSSILSEHRGWIIKEFEGGRAFVESIERINSAIMIYGFVRMATQMPGLAKNLLEARKSLLDAVEQRKMNRKLSGEQEMNLGKMDEAVQKIQQEIENVRAVNDDIELVEGTSSSTTKFGSRDTGTGSVGSSRATRTREESSAAAGTYPRARQREQGSSSVRGPHWDIGSKKPPSAQDQVLQSTGTDDLVPVSGDRGLSLAKVERIQEGPVASARNVERMAPQKITAGRNSGFNRFGTSASSADSPIRKEMLPAVKPPGRSGEQPTRIEATSMPSEPKGSSIDKKTLLQRDSKKNVGLQQRPGESFDEYEKRISSIAESEVGEANRSDYEKAIKSIRERSRELETKRKELVEAVGVRDDAEKNFNALRVRHRKLGLGIKDEHGNQTPFLEAEARFKNANDAFKRTKREFDSMDNPINKPGGFGEHMAAKFVTDRLHGKNPRAIVNPSGQGLDIVFELEDVGAKKRYSFAEVKEENSPLSKLQKNPKQYVIDKLSEHSVSSADAKKILDELEKGIAEIDEYLLIRVKDISRITWEAKIEVRNWITGELRP